MHPSPVALCIEDLDAAIHAERFIQCVALGGREPGLGLDVDGKVLWQTDQSKACELWVSADQRLVLYRLSHTPPVVVVRGDRTLDAPADKPVVLLHGDQLHLAGRRLRVHLHGLSPAIVPPATWSGSRAGQATKAAAVVAMGVAIGGCCRDPIEVRENPPAPPAQFDAAPPPDGASTGPFFRGDAAPETEPIEVRAAPPAVAPIRDAGSRPGPKR